MKKKYARIIAGVLIIIVLAALYFFFPSDGGLNDEPHEEESETAVKITEGEKENLKEIILKSGEGTTELENENGNWIIKGCKTELDKSAVESFIESMLSISAEEVVGADNQENRYGLDAPERSVCLKFGGGEEETVYIGKKTPDNNYYYAKKAGDDAIYIIDYINGERAAYTIDDFADKNVAQVSPYKIMKLNIKRKNAPEIDLEYTQEKQGNAQNLIEMGMETLKMNKPYEGLAVYPSNLQESVLSNINRIKLGKVVQASLENKGKYGLDYPEMETSLDDGENALQIIAGNKADNDNYYCIINDKKAIFLVDKEYIDPFLNADPIKFAEKFVALHYRADIQEASLSQGDYTLNITFEEEEKEDGENGGKNSRFNDDRKTYLNGKELDKSTFSDFFELFTGITFDKIDWGAKPADENAEAVIKYILKDGSADEIKFLPYNESFYIAEGAPVKGTLVSRQKVKRVFDKAKSLLSDETAE